MTTAPAELCRAESYTGVDAVGSISFGGKQFLRDHGRRRRPPGEASSLAWGALGYFVLGSALWLSYDRCALPLVVLVAALRLGTVGIRRPGLALGGVALLATVSGVGTWDHLRYSQALWDAVGWARRAGIEERELRRILAPSGRIYVIDQMPGASGSGSLLFGRDVGG